MRALCPNCIVSIDGASSSIKVEWTSWNDSIPVTPSTIARVRCRAAVADLVRDVDPSVRVMHAYVRSEAIRKARPAARFRHLIDWGRPTKLIVTRSMSGVTFHQDVIGASR